MIYQKSSSSSPSILSPSLGLFILLILPSIPISNCSFYSTHVLEYSLVVVSVVSIGHISTSALAAISLGSMTASVSAFSIIQGLASALDTLLPSAWSSSQPHLVGLWSHRMCTSSASLHNFINLKSYTPAIVMFACLMVRRPGPNLISSHSNIQ